MKPGRVVRYSPAELEQWIARRLKNRSPNHPSEQAMASMSKRPNGTFRIQFLNAEGRCMSVGLAKLTDERAREVKR